MSSTTYSQAHHRFAMFLAFCVFLLIVAGALVTSNDAGLAVPDWPTSFGSLYKIPPMVGGVKYEHGHRMIAQFVGLLTIIMAVWTQRVDQRRWMRVLGWFALLLVIVQGVIGGIGVRMFLPWPVTTGHAALAQTFFALTVLFALFTSREWIETAPKRLRDTHIFNLPIWTLAGLSVIYMQLILGAAFRHHGLHFLPHILGAGFATYILIVTAVRAITNFREVPEIRRPASKITWLLLLQLGLGIGSYMTRIEWTLDRPMPMHLMVAITVAHVAVGALLLATCFVLVVQAHRHVTGVPVAKTDPRELPGAAS